MAAAAAASVKARRTFMGHPQTKQDKLRKTASSRHKRRAPASGGVCRNAGALSLRYIALLDFGTSMPCALMTAVAAGDVRCLTKALAASGSLALAPTAA